MNQRIAIVDYGVGNTESIRNALAFLGCQRVTITSRRADLESADQLILPGVGAFDVAMRSLREHGLDEVLSELVLGKGTPILGICLGMQLLATNSDENGLHDGLNWIPGRVSLMKPGAGLPVPHVGWNVVAAATEAPVFARVPADAHFYFDHSYAFVCDERYVSATCNYGGTVVAAVQLRNIHGVQFHPEKSQVNGFRLFRGFLNTTRGC